MQKLGQSGPRSCFFFCFFVCFFVFCSFVCLFFVLFCFLYSWHALFAAWVVFTKLHDSSFENTKFSASGTRGTPPSDTPRARNWCWRKSPPPHVEDGALDQIARIQYIKGILHLLPQKAPKLASSSFALFQNYQHRFEKIYASLVNCPRNSNSIKIKVGQAVLELLIQNQHFGCYDLYASLSMLSYFEFLDQFFIRWTLFFKKLLIIWDRAQNMVIFGRRCSTPLRGYCTPGPYLGRLCAFSQKIKQLRTKYSMDLVRNVPRNSKNTVLLQLRPLLWSYSAKCELINIYMFWAINQ